MNICSICVTLCFSTIHNIRHDKRIVQNMHTMFVNQGPGSIRNSIAFDTLDLTDKMWLFQFKLQSITTPKNVVDFTLLIFSLFILTQISAVILRLPKSCNLFWYIKRQTINRNHVCSCSNPAFIIRTSSFKSLSQHNTFVSSANKIYLNTRETLQMSLIYMINNGGPKMEPWGTPQDTFSISEWQLLKLTNCFLFSK